jgi:hypothetical protein
MAPRAGSPEVLRLGLQERRKIAADLDYVPLPDSVKAGGRFLEEQRQGRSGKAIW